MDPLSVTASIITLLDVVGKLIEYARNVKKEDDDIADIKTQTDALSQLFGRLKHLLEDPQNTKLLAVIDPNTLSECNELLASLQKRLEKQVQNSGSAQPALPTTSSSQESKLKKWKQKFSSSIQTFVWPFTKPEFDKILANLKSYYSIIESTLQTEQIQLIVDIDQDKNLSKLPVAEGATFGSYEDQFEPECLPNTRVDLLEDIANWVAEPAAPRVFWLYGMAGTGKSTISRTVAKTLSTNKQLGASFFFKRGKANRDASRFFSTIANDLTIHIPHLRPLISRAIENDPKIYRKALNEQFNNLILKPLSRLPQNVISMYATPVVILIDALDECENESDAGLIFELLAQLQDLKVIDVRLFITSRPEISPDFDGITKGKHKELILHDIQQSTIKHDIFSFLKHEFAIIQKTRKMPKDWPGDDAIKALSERATPLFIFASVVCRFVAEKRFPAQSRLDIILGSTTANSKFTSKVDAIYEPVLNQLLVDLDNPDELDILKDFDDILGTIVLLEAPLSRSALSQLIKKSEDEVHCILVPIRSILDTPDDSSYPIQIFHQSFPDFLLDGRRKGMKFFIDRADAHKRIAIYCIELLATHLREDICNLGAPETLLSDISRDVIDNHIPESVQYACRYWLYHLRQPGLVLDEHDFDMLYQFLSKHLLHWLEAMILLGYSFHIVHLFRDLLLPSLSDDDTSIRQALTKATMQPLFIKSAPIYSRFIELINDIIRFVQSNQKILETAPLQLYSSSICFAPEECTVKRLFSSAVPAWILRKPAARLKWGNLIHTLEYRGGYGSYVTFSPNGSKIAAVSKDTRFRMWDTLSGILVQTLEVGDKFEHLAFSPSSENHVAFSARSLVEIWDIELGRQLQTFRTQRTKIHVIKFSPDGKVLAVGASAGFLALWNIDHQSFLYHLKGHDGIIWDLAFSSSGERLVSACDDCPARLWDVQSGKQMLEFEVAPERESQGKLTVAFSSDDTEIILAGARGRVLILDATSGALLRNIECTWDKRAWPPRRVTISAKLGIIAGAGKDGRVHVCDLSDGSRIKTLKGHHNRDSRGSVGFSQDGDLLVSPSASGNTIKIWNMGYHGSDFPEFCTHAENLAPLTISQDSKWLVSPTLKTVEVWDVNTGSLSHSFAGHKFVVSSLAVSYDSKWLLSVTDPQKATALLWCLGSNTLAYTFNDWKDVSALAFSPDNKSIAWTSKDFINLWSCNLERLWFLPSKVIYFYMPEPVGHLTYSPDGRSLILAGHGGREVYIVDTESETLLSCIATKDLSHHYVSGMTLSSHYLALSLQENNPNAVYVGRGQPNKYISIRSLIHGEVQNLKGSGTWPNFSRDGQFIETEIGRTRLQPGVSLGTPDPTLSSITIKDSWFCLNGRRVLLLAEEYRPICMVFTSNLMAIRCEDGHIYFLEFSEPPI